MKCFADLSWCYRPTTTAPSRQEEDPGSTSLQVVLVGANHHERISCSGRKKMNANWRPGLSVISEDVVVSVLKSDRRKDNSEKKVPSKSRSTATVRSSIYNDHYFSRKNSMPLIVPAFSPTPFMF